MLAQLRSDVADDLATSGARELALADRRELARQLALTRLRDAASERVALGESPIDPAGEQRLAHAVLDALFGLGRLQGLVDDPEVENIDVNGCDRVWVTYANGRKAMVDPIADSDAELVEVLRSAAARFGLSERRFDTAHPELDLRLPDGSRLSALMSVVSRPAISIRRHRYVDLSLTELETLGTVDEFLHSLLAAAVRARKNIVVGGAMNSGKTTLIRALSAEIPVRERVVTIEQAFELGLDAMPDRHPDLVALEARNANSEGEGGITMARLVRRALRMNADRVIVGEVLGDEVLPMLNAMSQGRSGSMCTIHADSSSGVFRRLASYAVQAPERLPLESTNMLIAGSVHFVVDVVDEPEDKRQSDMAYLSWRHADGGREPGRSPVAFKAVARRRFVSSVREVIDAEGLQVISNEVYRTDRAMGTVPAAPLRSATLEELVENGFEPSSRRADAAIWRRPQLSPRVLSESASESSASWPHVEGDMLPNRQTGRRRGSEGPHLGGGVSIDLGQHTPFTVRCRSWA
jgi:Flp pilus assembly CpaF family ATPase